MEAVTFTITAVFAEIVGIGPVIVGMLRAHKRTVVGRREVTCYFGESRRSFERRQRRLEIRNVKW